MSVYVSKRSESKTLFLETARKLSAHTLTYCLKAPKRLTFFLTKDICGLARNVYYEANIANGIDPENKMDVQNRKMHFQQALSACENMELPLSELKARLELNPEESKDWKTYAFQEWGTLSSICTFFIVGVSNNGITHFLIFLFYKIAYEGLQK